MRRRKVKYKSNKIIFMSLIISMSFIGVGYASWNDTATICMTIKTGCIKPTFCFDDIYPDVEGGNIKLIPSKDGYTLKVEGEVYPNFNDDINIKIKEEGSIPSVFKKLDKDENENTNLFNNKTSKLRSNNINTEESLIESFKIEIKHDYSDEDKFLKMNAMNFEQEEIDSILSIDQEISKLQEKIDQYKNLEDNIKFNYKLYFEQGI